MAMGELTYILMLGTPEGDEFHTSDAILTLLDNGLKVEESDWYTHFATRAEADAAALKAMELIDREGWTVYSEECVSLN